LFSKWRGLNSVREFVLGICSGSWRRGRNVDHLRHVSRQCRRRSQRYRKLGFVSDLALDLRRFSQRLTAGNAR
jgi:hypothetical protein